MTQKQVLELAGEKEKEKTAFETEKQMMKKALSEYLKSLAENKDNAAHYFQALMSHVGLHENDVKELKEAAAKAKKQQSGIITKLFS